MTDTVLAQLAALKTTPTPQLKQQWRDLFDTRAAALQPALPRKPARLPHPGTGLRRAEARDAGAAGGARPSNSTAAIATRRRQRGQGPADRRHPADPRMAGRRALRHGARRRLRVSGPALQIALGDRPRHHRHALERLVFFGLKNQRGACMKKPIVRKLRCAVYTRKSTEEGLEQEFNCLDAQREACEAYIASQKAEGWLLVPDRYDDGGFSGGTLERPALQAAARRHRGAARSTSWSSTRSTGSAAR